MALFRGELLWRGGLEEVKWRKTMRKAACAGRSLEWSHRLGFAD